MKLYLESLLGRYEKDHFIAEIYKNPQTLKNFSQDIRGVLLKNGDLYIMENLFDDGEIAQYGSLIHTDLIQLLSRAKILSTSFRNFEWENAGSLLDYLDVFVLVTRSGKTDMFTLSESYGPEIEEIEDNPEDNEWAVEILEKYQNKMMKLGFTLKLEPAY